MTGPEKVRELKNVAERYVLSDQLTTLNLPSQISVQDIDSKKISLHEQVQQFEKSLMIQELKKQQGGMSENPVMH